MAWILLVDDEPPVRDALGQLFEVFGHDCVAVENGYEALVQLHEREFDVIVSDVLMPRMNGFQLLERILPYVEERVPFVVLSSVRGESEIRDALFAGAFDYLTKPCEAEEVEAVLARALAHRERHRGPRRLRGGPVPAEALVVDPKAEEAAAKIPIRSGIPVFREEPRVLAVAPPAEDGADATKHRTPPPRRAGMLRRLLRKRRAG